MFKRKPKPTTELSVDSRRIVQQVVTYLERNGYFIITDQSIAEVQEDIAAHRVDLTVYKPDNLVDDLAAYVASMEEFNS